MSGQFINITLTPSAQKIASSLKSFPIRMLDEMIKALDRENQLTIGHITEARLTGKGPFPVAEGKLGVRTGHLRRSLRASRAVAAGTQITSTIGTNVVYAGVHEFGGTFKRTQLAGSVRLRTGSDGNLMRQASNPRLAVFARGTHKRFTNVPFSGGKRFTVSFPARAPIRRGIEDRMANYSAALSAAIERTALLP
jgi:hypothetical protein